MDDYAGPGVPTFRPRCEAAITPNDLTYQCERAEGHEGQHRAWKISWTDESFRVSVLKDGSDLEGKAG